MAKIFGEVGKPVFTHARFEPRDRPSAQLPRGVQVRARSARTPRDNPVLVPGEVVAASVNARSFVAQKNGDTNKTAKPPKSKMRSTAQTATCEAKGQVLAARNQIGTNQFPGPPQQAIPVNPITVGETRPGRTIWAHRAKEDFPSHRPHRVGEVDERDAWKMWIHFSGCLADSRAQSKFCQVRNCR